MKTSTSRRIVIGSATRFGPTRPLDSDVVLTAFPVSSTLDLESLKTSLALLNRVPGGLSLVRSNPRPILGIVRSSRETLGLYRDCPRPKSG